MQFIIKAYDGEGMLEKRIAIRSRHFESIDKIRKHVICTGAIRDEAGKMIGSLLVMEYDSREEVDQYIANEPYAQDHVWERIEIEPMTVAILDGERTALWPADTDV